MSTDKHWQALTSIDKYLQVLTSGDKQWQAVTSSDKCWQSLTSTVVVLLGLPKAILTFIPWGKPSNTNIMQKSWVQHTDYYALVLNSHGIWLHEAFLHTDFSWLRRRGFCNFWILLIYLIFAEFFWLSWDLREIYLLLFRNPCLDHI